MCWVVHYAIDCNCTLLLVYILEDLYAIDELFDLLFLLFHECHYKNNVNRDPMLLTQIVPSQSEDLMQ